MRASSGRAADRQAREFNSRVVVQQLITELAWQLARAEATCIESKHKPKLETIAQAAQKGRARENNRLSGGALHCTDFGSRQAEAV